MRFLVLVIQLARDGVDKGEARCQFVGRKVRGRQFGPGLFKSDFGGREMDATSEAFHTPHKLPIAGVAGDNFHSIQNKSQAHRLAFVLCPIAAQAGRSSLVAYFLLTTILPVLAI